MIRKVAQLIPPSIADERSRAFGATMERALSYPQFDKLLFERIDTVDAALLPFLIREFSIEEFVAPDMSEAVIRRLLKGAYELHSRKGYIDGVRTGLAMLGVTVSDWQQWFETSPKGAPGTHIINIKIAAEIFEADGKAITARMQRAVTRMVGGMKRFSQDIAVRVGVESTVPLHAAAAVTSRIYVKPTTSPVTQLIGKPLIFIGAGVSTRLHIKPQVSA